MSAKPALDWTNFLLADVKDGVGPFLSIYLMTARHWNAAQIGVVMSVAGGMFWFAVPETRGARSGASPPKLGRETTLVISRGVGTEPRGE